MVNVLSLFYRSELADNRITRAEARQWMEDKRKIGRSEACERVMWDDLERYRDAFEPGAREEVEAFLAVEADARFRKPSLLSRILTALFGSPDEDGDGLTEAEEHALNTNPFRADTDGDGVSDADEVRNGTHAGEFLAR